MPERDAGRETLRESEREEQGGIDGRKATILRAVVAEHIVTAQPVGSGLLSAATGLGISSATIRNELSALERDGFLTHPHTSAGRIPTDKGYRFYVDSLHAPGRLSSPKTQQVRQFFDGAHGELEQLLSETSKLLSNLTAYAAVVVRPQPEGSPIRSIQLVGLGAATAIVVAVLANGTVEKATLDIGSELSEQQIAAVNAQLAHVAVGRLPAALGAGLRATGEARVDAVVGSALGAFLPAGEGDAPDVFVGGASRMASAFETVDTIRQVLAVLEEQYVVVSLLREAIERSAVERASVATSVSIGAEHGADHAFESLLTCSVVVAPYMVDGRAAGTIGVLGPTRMDYPEAMAAVMTVSESLSQRLAEG